MVGSRFGAGMELCCLQLSWSPDRMEEMDLELADLSQRIERISQDIDMPSTPSY